MAPQNGASSIRDTPDERTPPRHPGKTILVFSLALTPLAVLPYVLVRRHVLGLRKEIADLRKASVAAVKEMRMSTQAMSQECTAASDSASKLLKENRALLAAIKSEVAANRKATEENGARLERMEERLSQLKAAMTEMNREAGVRASDLKNMLSVANTIAKERETKAQAWRNNASTTMETLLQEKQGRERTATPLGRSLADIAAFMQEVELRQGWVPRPDDGRGIERIRGLAKRLDESANTQHSNKTNPRLDSASAESTGKQSPRE